jgi:branched-chain amino acid transport system ATP-binding protein
MRTGTILSQGSRAEFGGNTDALVARWLYASGNTHQA